MQTSEFQKVASKFEEVKEEILKAESNISSNQRNLKETLEKAEKMAIESLNELRKLREDLS
ncbi:MAG TPA: hypothetical protein VJI68_01510 [Candidatus Nanoarchaeia archaeon]|nr:hypothetical protein [Candidatus Nanoarchaeia archaeon]